LATVTIELLLVKVALLYWPVLTLDGDTTSLQVDMGRFVSGTDVI
jgi:hypothetical protein